MNYSVNRTVDASRNDARSRAAHSHAQPQGGEHGAHGARSRRTLDRAATPHALRMGYGDNSPASLPRGERERAREGNPSRLGANGALDNHASNVSTLIDWRELRYRLRRTAGRIIGGRQAKCGVTPLLSLISMLRPTDRNRFSGLETCGSVWTCPVCAMKISAHRCGEVQTVIRSHLAAGGLVLMLTLTIPHHRFQTPKELLDAVRGTWRKVKQGRTWVRAREKHGWLGDVRALETTHGDNGWHPHLHVLLFLHPGFEHEDGHAFAEWIFARWQRFVEKGGYGLCSRSAFKVELVEHPEKVGEYLGLWGAAQELTLAEHKQGKGGRTPWQILYDASRHGRADDAALFRAYGEAFKGARQLTWSRGLRSLYLPQPEQSDEQAAADDGADTPEALKGQRTLALTTALWRVIYRRGLPVSLLNSADEGGAGAAMAFLQEMGIAFVVVEWIGLAPILGLPPQQEPSSHAIRSSPDKVATAPPAWAEHSLTGGDAWKQHGDAWGQAGVGREQRGVGWERPWFKATTKPGC